MPIFQSLLENATRICGAQFGVLWLREGDLFRAVAANGGPTAYREMLFRAAIRPGPDTGLGMLLKTKRFVQIDDITKGKAYLDRDPLRVATVELAGGRTLAEVPLLKDGELIGSINIYHQEVRPFTEKQVELLTSFAAQAVIAIENTRLLNELRESLQQQTATADVLKVISRSTFDLQTVLDTLTESATRLCAVDQGVIFLRDGDVLRLRASFGFPPEAVKFALAHPMLPNRGSATGRVALEGRPVHIHDVLADPEYSVTDYQRTFGYRTVLSVPLLREGATIGVFALTRDVVKPFSDRQIELATTFADQAVIAIENVRLFEQVQKRTDELTESLQQQTATAEVLEVISRSTFDLQTVLDTLVGSANRFCEADGTIIWRPDDDRYRMSASYGLSPEFKDQLDDLALKPDGRSVVGRALQSGQMLHIPDISTDPDYPSYDLRRLGGYRAILGVPLMREGMPIGVMMVGRTTPGAFTEAQIALVTTFADQAGIAIENTRLLNELRHRTDELSEALERQTATSDVLKVISSSQGELEPIFDVILENVTRVCEAKFGSLYLYDGDVFHVGALHNAPRAFAEARRREPTFRPHPGTGLAAVAATLQTAHTADMTQERGYIERDPFIVAGVELGGYRTVVTVPMLRDNHLVGCINIYRQEVRPFTDKQIALVESLAAQAVIAIENARLLGELRQRTDDLSESIGAADRNLEGARRHCQVVRRAGIGF